MDEKQDDEASFDFETLVNRKGIGNLKESMSPDSMRESDMVNYVAAEMDFKTAN